MQNGSGNYAEKDLPLHFKLLNHVGMLQKSNFNTRHIRIYSLQISLLRYRPFYQFMLK